MAALRPADNFCSDECRTQQGVADNQLAVERLLAVNSGRRTRPVSISTGRLTVLAHPPGASKVLRDEPPEAEFLNILAPDACLRALWNQFGSWPEAIALCIPVEGPAITGGLAELAEALRPSPQPARTLSTAASAAAGGRALPDTPWPECEPAWPDRLGLRLRVVGLEDLASIAGTEESRRIEAAAGAVSHRSIPARRGRRPFGADLGAALGTPAAPLRPTVAAPRLRIHLPKPSLMPFRPRYRFAPEPAAPVLTAIAVPKPVSSGLVAPNLLARLRAIPRSSPARQREEMA